MIRRRMNRRKKKTKAISIVLFVFLFVGIGAGYSMINRQFQISGTSTITKTQQYNGIGTVELELKQVWGTYTYDYGVTITNTGATQINGWVITMNVPSDATVVANVGIASISDGILTIKNQTYNGTIAAGATLTTLEITITTAQSNYEYNYLTFNGIEMNLTGEVIEPTAMTLNQTTATIYEGNTINLIPVFTPSNATGEVSWSSSNTAIATVDSGGIVTGVAPGNATITATSGDLTATCGIIVNTLHAVSDDLDVVFTAGNNYPSSNGYTTQYSVTIENICTSTITGWSFDLILPANGRIAGYWGANVTSSGNTYTFSDLGWNGTLAPNATAQSVGIQIETPYQTYTPIATNIVTTK